MRPGAWTIGKTAAMCAALSCVVMTACGSGGDRETAATTTTVAAAPSTSAPSTTTTEPQSEEAAILAAVEGYWATILAANNPPNPDHPDLERYLTGEALEKSLSNIRERHQLSQAVRLPENSLSGSSASVDQIEESSASVLDCVVDDGVLYDLPSGTVLNDATSTIQFRVTLLRTDDGWKVAGLEALQKWDGVAGCALDS